MGICLLDIICLLTKVQFLLLNLCSCVMICIMITRLVVWEEASIIS